MQGKKTISEWRAKQNACVSRKRTCLLGAFNAYRLICWTTCFVHRESLHCSNILSYLLAYECACTCFGAICCGNCECSFRR